MRKLRLKKYDMTLMYIPVLIISCLSVAAYVIRLFSRDTADAVFFVGTAAVLCFFLTAGINNRAFKIILVLLCVGYISVYFVLGNSLFALAAQKFSSNAVTFGFFDSLFNTAGIYDFQTLVYTTSYGGARLIGNQLVCGVSEIVKTDPDSSLVPYLSGRILSLFAFSGILLAKKDNLRAHLLIIAFMFISGNTTPVLILLLFTSPVSYFLLLLANFFSFFAANMLDIGGAFVVSPSVFEIFYHSENVIYLLAVSALFCAVAYYLARVVSERKK